MIDEKLEAELIALEKKADKHYKTYKERQEEKEQVLLTRAGETKDQRAERIARGIRTRMSKGSSHYAMTPTRDESGRGRTIVNKASERPKGKAALKAAKKIKVERLKGKEKEI